MKNLIYNLAIFWQIFAIPIIPNITNPVVAQKPSEPGIVMPVFRQIDKLPVSHIETLQPIQPIKAEEATTQAPNTANSTAIVAQVVNGCGDNSYANYIYMHESGCNTGARNSIGCLGIGQACPGSKLYAVCPNLDYGCENSFFTAYASAAYGGWAGAYQHWLNYSWW